MILLVQAGGDGFPTRAINNVLFLTTGVQNSIFISKSFKTYVVYFFNSDSLPNKCSAIRKDSVCSTVVFIFYLVPAMLFIVPLEVPAKYTVVTTEMRSEYGLSMLAKVHSRGSIYCAIYIQYFKHT